MCIPRDVSMVNDGEGTCLKQGSPAAKMDETYSNNTGMVRISNDISGTNMDQGGLIWMISQFIFQYG